MHPIKKHEYIAAFVMALYRYKRIEMVSILAKNIKLEDSLVSKTWSQKKSI